MFESILTVRAYEPETTAAILSHLKPGDLFIDVGANNGYFSVLAASLVGESGKVIAIEPATGPFGRLQRNIELNGFASRVQPVHAAAAANEGETTLFLNPWDDGWTSTNQPTRYPVKVRTLTLDSIVAPHDRVTVKLDVEGDELAVLRGMRTMIAGVTSLTVVVEWNQKYATAALRRFLFDTFVVSRIVPTRAGYDLRQIPESTILRGIALSNLWCEKRTGPRAVP